MSATTQALIALHAALVADGFDPGVDALQLSELVADGLALLDPLDEEGAAEETLTCACERASAGIRRALKDWPAPPTAPACGHSACSQSFIDTGIAECFEHPAWYLTERVHRTTCVHAPDPDAAWLIAHAEGYNDWEESVIDQITDPAA